MQSSKNELQAHEDHLMSRPLPPTPGEGAQNNPMAEEPAQIDSVNLVPSTAPVSDSGGRNRIKKTLRQNSKDDQDRRPPPQSLTSSSERRAEYKNVAPVRTERQGNREEETAWKYIKEGTKKVGRGIQRFAERVEGREEIEEDDGGQDDEEYVRRLQWRCDQQQKWIKDLQFQVQDKTDENKNLRNEMGRIMESQLNYESARKMQAMEGAKFKASAEQMVKVLEAKDLAIGPQASDPTIISNFEGITGRLKTWSLSFVADCRINPERMDNGFIRYIQRLAPEVQGPSDIQRLVDNKSRRRYLAQALVGQVLFDEVFISYELDGRRRAVHGLDWWIPQQIALGVRSIEDALNATDRERKLISYRELSDWRALTISLLSQFERRTLNGNFLDDNIQRMTRDIMASLAGWFPEQKYREVSTGLYNLIESAIKFSQTLRSQRAQWSICYDTNPEMATSQRFNSRYMKDIDVDSDDEGEEPQQDDTKVVQLRIFPGLFKRGDADGQNYDVEECYVKSKVRCVAVHELHPTA